MAGKGGALHESFARPKPISGSSNRSVGLVFACFFVVLAGLSWWDGGYRWSSYLVVAVLFAAVALVAPSILTPLNRVWTAFGLLLHRIVNPIIMGIIFFGVVTPLGVLMRLLNKRPLDLRFRTPAPTYWNKRPTNEPGADSMTQQF